MKPKKPMRIEDVEFYPDAMERLERAAKAMAKHGPIPTEAIKKASQKKTKKRRATRRP